MLKTMDQDLARDLIGQTKDVLTPAMKAEEELYRNTRCPMCYEGGCIKKIPPPRIIVGMDGPTLAVPAFGDDMLPLGYAHCIHCGTNFNPKTNVIMSTEASMIHAPASTLHRP